MAMRSARLPVNVYQELSRVMVAAPVPGMEPQNIRLVVEGQRLSIQASLRGPGQERTQQYALREWSAGPYRRTVELPAPVNADLANATYDNGILVVILPVSEQPTSGAIVMPKVGTAKGRLIRHVGLVIRPPT